jgi:hypothetical protein
MINGDNIELRGVPKNLYSLHGTYHCLYENLTYLCYLSLLSYLVDMDCSIFKYSHSIAASVGGWILPLIGGHCIYVSD